MSTTTSYETRAERQQRKASRADRRRRPERREPARAPAWSLTLTIEDPAHLLRLHGALERGLEPSARSRITAFFHRDEPDPSEPELPGQVVVLASPELGDLAEIAGLLETSLEVEPMRRRSQSA